MNQTKNKEKIIKEFRAKFPPFTGVGARFPIFKNTPNYNQIEAFLLASLQEVEDRVRKEMIKEIGGMSRKKYIKGEYKDRRANGYNEALSDVLEKLSNLEEGK